MRGAIYHFHAQDAHDYGLAEAVMIYNLAFWIGKNRASGKHYHDGRTWTYNSIQAFRKLFPFWTRHQIEHVLKSLEKQGVIRTGNFNETAFDRTRWFAFEDEERFLVPDLDISEESEMEDGIIRNGSRKQPKSYTYNKPDNKPDEKERISAARQGDLGEEPPTLTVPFDAQPFSGDGCSATPKGGVSLPDGKALVGGSETLQSEDMEDEPDFEMDYCSEITLEPGKEKEDRGRAVRIYTYKAKHEFQHDGHRNAWLTALYSRLFLGYSGMGEGYARDRIGFMGKIANDMKRITGAPPGLKIVNRLFDLYEQPHVVASMRAEGKDLMAWLMGSPAGVQRRRKENQEKTKKAVEKLAQDTKSVAGSSTLVYSDWEKEYEEYEKLRKEQAGSTENAPI
jgi:hypothetical protein